MVECRSVLTSYIRKGIVGSNPTLSAKSEIMGGIQVERLFETHTAYQHVLIERHPSWGRLLRLDGLVHSSEVDKDLYHQ